MKRLLIVVMALAIFAGAFVACLDGKVTPTPISEQAPGAYQPLGAGNIGTVTSGSFTSLSTSIGYLVIANMTSAQLATIVSNEDGTGQFVLGSSPYIWSATLHGPIFATISNTGTLTLPTSTDTLVGRNTTDTLTNKTLTTPTVATPTFTGGLLIATTAFSGGTGVIVLGNGAVPSAMNSTIQLYATGGKLYAMDSAGTITTLTP